MTTPGGNEALVRALLAVSRSMVALAVRNLAAMEADVTLPQYRTLVLLATAGPQRSAGLAKELDVAPSTLTRMCDRLERKLLVRRFHRDNDRRSTWLALTPAGRDLVGVVMRERQRELSALVQQAGLDASQECLDLLDRIVEASGELPDGLWWDRWEVSADPVDSVTLP
ncbi:MarR family transcriptional regulator [Dactylosporangium aurantiacum]|uniref:MarR family transcriptional regulator n=1 Tax=Dactylosporangium aurantiacum TaxID=35754 RepID=A0A9Q9IP37_9ACTN|nr:MarR family transcriptional regulator [Dactylosporangium aurantiacum]MDG6109955.1 MarR family transcriptional regulator [Dactylosporangium aurantiacum]UWZ57292.1 MarR family transcriptional regulator [Dactylosporangium aurantiacum]